MEPQTKGDVLFRGPERYRVLFEKNRSAWDAPPVIDRELAFSDGTYTLDVLRQAAVRVQRRGLLRADVDASGNPERLPPLLDDPSSLRYSTPARATDGVGPGVRGHPSAPGLHLFIPDDRGKAVRTRSG